jgi:TPR repeat protein
MTVTLTRQGQASGGLKPVLCVLCLMVSAAFPVAGEEQPVRNDPLRLRSMCDRKETFGCYRLGTLYAAGVGVPKELTKALVLFRSVCTKAETRGCAAVDCYSGRPERCGAYAADAANETHAAELHERACGAGVGRSCYWIGERRRLDSDYVAAGRYHEDACHLGEPEGCFMLGVLYATGLGRATDRARALVLWEQACDSGLSRGCFNAVFEYAAGRARPRTASYAFGVFKKACDAGQGQGCWELGKVYASGTGVPKDSAKARDALLKACHDGGIKEACEDASRLGQ